MVYNGELINNMDKLHTTKLGIERIKQNLGLATDNVVEWCTQAIRQSDEIIRTGKNWYIKSGNAVITINANSYTIITAYKIRIKGGKYEFSNI